jgi:hypothetical protein
MKFNFTNTAASPSMAAMAHRDHATRTPDHPSAVSARPARSGGAPASAETAAPARWRTVWHRLAEVLARAERRITANFRAPPGGG